MNETRELIDEIADRYAFPEGAFDRMRTRRDRKRRNQRVGTGLVAFIVMSAVVGSFLFSYLRSTGLEPVTGSINPENVGSLHLTWSAELDGAASAREVGSGTLVYPPTVSGETVYVGTRNGSVYAFPVSCGSPCDAVWIGRTDGGIVHSPTVADGQVFVATDAGLLYAFPEECTGACPPLWIGDTGGQLGASPIVAGGMVYGVSPATGTLFAFPERCEPGPDGLCQPAWQTTFYGGDRSTGRSSFGVEGESAPVVAGDQIFAIAQANGEGDGDLFAFDAATGVLRWRSAIGGGSHYLARPAVDEGQVFAVIGPSTIYAFPRRCGSDGTIYEAAWSTPLEPFWSPHQDPNDTFMGPIVAADGVVYATCCFSGSGHVFAFDASGGGHLLWEGRFGGAGAWNYPVVSGEFVYLTGEQVGGEEGSLSAFDTRCTDAGGTCEPTWAASVEGLAGGPFHPSTPIAMGGVLFAGTTGGDVVAYPAACATPTCPFAWTWFSGRATDALSTPAGGVGTIFVAQESGRLLAFSPLEDEAMAGSG